MAKRSAGQTGHHRYDELTPENLRDRAIEVEDIAYDLRRIALKMEELAVLNVKVDGATKYPRGLTLLDQFVRHVRVAMVPFVDDEV